MPIIPTVGRIVWFYEKPHALPQAAIVVFVVNDELVDLHVFGFTGHSRYEHGVPLIEAKSEVPARYCSWMPYQIGQAAKTELLEAKRAEVQ